VSGTFLAFTSIGNQLPRSPEIIDLSADFGCIKRGEKLLMALLKSIAPTLIRAAPDAW
jgi:hypothetical protein